MNRRKPTVFRRRGFTPTFSMRPTVTVAASNTVVLWQWAYMAPAPPRPRPWKLPHGRLAKARRRR